jgi:PAS domain S-box-containing protein
MQRASEGFFENLIDYSDDLIQVITVGGKVRYSSFLPESLVRYDANGLPEKLEPFQWIHPDDRDRVLDAFEAHKKAGFDTYLIDYRLIAISGEIIYVNTKVINATQKAGIGGYVMVIRNITQRVEAKESIQRQQVLYELMTNISKRFLNSEIAPAVAEMLEKVGQFSGADRCYVYLLDAQQRYWHCLHEWRSAVSEPFGSIYYEKGIDMDSAPWMYEQFLQEKIISYENLEDIPPEAATLKAACELDNTVSILLIPMQANDQVMGFIGFDSVVQTKKWQGDDVKVLFICTEILTSALLRSEAEKAARQSLLEEQQKSVAQAQLASLKTHVNPHFLFNSLNVLSSLVHIDAELSEKFIDRLARSYRYLLEQKDEELVSLKTEIDFVNAFTFLLKIRFEDKLQVRIQLDAQAMQHQVAPLTLQLLIENAVKHNTISAESPLILNIYAQEDWLVVSNNLQLREGESSSTGVGLKNIKSRYKFFTGKEPVFLIENDQYIAKIPLIKPKK